MEKFERGRCKVFGVRSKKGQKNLSLYMNWNSLRTLNGLHIYNVNFFYCNVNNNILIAQLYMNISSSIVNYICINLMWLSWLKTYKLWKRMFFLEFEESEVNCLQIMHLHLINFLWMKFIFMYKKNLLIGIILL